MTEIKQFHIFDFKHERLSPSLKARLYTYRTSSQNEYLPEVIVHHDALHSMLVMLTTVSPVAVHVDVVITSTSLNMSTASFTKEP